jgi:hypothetical protein
MFVSRKIFVALALTPCIVVAQDTPSGDLFTWSGRLATGATVAVRSYNGPIDVRESTTDRVEFRASRPTRRGAELSFEVETTANGVQLCAVYRGRNICDSSRRGGWDGDWDQGPGSTRVTVLLPKGVRLEARTGNGEVTIDRASNDVDVSTGNGDVRVRLTAGRVDARTGNGELDIEGATGPVEASTGNGRVTVTTSTGPVSVSTGNGEIDVRMNAISGTGDMEFATGNGSVTVAVPANFNGDIEARTGHGEFRSDFEIRVQGRLNPRNIRGTIGSGGRRIRMVSGNGALELRRAN